MNTLLEALPAIGTTGVGTALAMKSPELLKEIYGDLAKPGVKQVGEAIGSLLGLGNTILLPLRLLNEVGRAFEQEVFSQIADRFKKIPDDRIVSPPPEIGIPLLDRLSQTQDTTLREMFIELLARASDSQAVDQVHPSFSQVISSIVPDEAILLRGLYGRQLHPIISVNLISKDADKGSIVLHDCVMKLSIQIKQEKNLSLYLSNLVGLGVLDIDRERHLVTPHIYDDTINYAKQKFSLPDEIIIDSDSRKVGFTKFICGLSPYGRRLIEASS
ncbi:DUF4393 domain-containing protein [Sphingobium vermicomposti]|uniref:DUF4393 domain-containing protein n=1 Tax=Sphingobium vermicomposti TaxID=529005 RepID=A0A846MA40_9SPHN|nr:DUF4393 domain-containing protein [Sphingobium vermicomposti]NIJ17510.1 hypothetical protein [Sphingobium vermicomposti]